HEIGLAQGQHVGPGQPGEHRHRRDADGQRAADGAGPHDRRQQQRGQHGRKRTHRVHEAHEPFVHPAAGPRGCAADDGAQGGAETDGDGAHHQRRAGAGQDAAEQVPPELVGAQPVFRVGRLKAPQHLGLDGVVGQPDQADQRHGRRQPHQRQADVQIPRAPAGRAAMTSLHAYRILGSRYAYSKSLTKLKNTMAPAMTTTTPWVSGKSRLWTAVKARLPRPGSENTCSMMTAPASSCPSSRTMTVLMVMRALRSTWRESTRASGTPLARAVRTKSRPNTSRAAARTMRVSEAARAAPKAAAGSSSACSAGPQPASQPGKPPAGSQF